MKYCAIVLLAIWSSLHWQTDVANAQGTPKGIAICIGLNSVDPSHYSGWSGRLSACEYDAQDMADIATSKGFSTVKLLTSRATRQATLAALSSAATDLKGGDILVVSYSGHGGQTPDQNGDESDNQDETWCLFDGQMIDDELASVWTTFVAGVRIVVFSDSCHSGTVTRFTDYSRMLGNVAYDPVEVRALENRFEKLLSAKVDETEQNTISPVRAMPQSIANQTYRSNKRFYDDLGGKVATEAKSRSETKSTVLLISGCQDNQLSADGTFNGLFTGKLKQVWANGAFHGTYVEFKDAILARMPPYQSPNYYLIGSPNSTFELQVPWTK